MFKCAGGHITQPNQKQHKLVTQKRQRQYSEVSFGWEIGKEVNVCAEHEKTGIVFDGNRMKLSKLSHAQKVQKRRFEQKQILATLGLIKEKVNES